MNKLVILIPTYNEALSIVELLNKLSSFRMQGKYPYDLVVIDDDSPDHTADIVENLSLPWVRVMRRTVKDGLGAAYRAGFQSVLVEQKYTHIITMDADGSHRVEDLPAMFEAMESTTSVKTIILGTRWIPGGGTVNWPIFRRFLSKAGTRYAKLALGLELDDLTGGFRIYSAALLNSLNLKEMHATGYCFQIEMAMAGYIAGASAIQVPITSIEREAGKSKMSAGIAIEALIFISRAGINGLVGRRYRR